MDIYINIKKIEEDLVEDSEDEQEENSICE